MKKLLFIGILGLLIVQSNRIFASETQRKGLDWFLWKIGWKQGPLVKQEAQKLKKESTERFKQAMGASVLAGAGTTLAVSDIKQSEGFGQSLVKVLGIEGISPEKAILLGVGVLSFTYVAYVYTIKELIQGFSQRKLPRERAVAEVKKNIADLLKNITLYPTLSSKKNMLIQRDEFQQYIRDEDDIVKDACGQLLAEMNATEPILKPGEIGYAEQIGKYAEEKKLIDDAETADKPINDYMLKLKTQINHLLLQDQIKALEDIKDKQKFSIEEAQAWMSLYHRAKAKLAIEKELNLTPKEKSERDPWRIVKKGETSLVSTKEFATTNEQHQERMKEINEITKKIIEARRSLFTEQGKLEKASKESKSDSEKQDIQKLIDEKNTEIESLIEERENIIQPKQAQRALKSQSRIQEAQRKEDETAQKEGRAAKTIGRLSEEDFKKYEIEFAERQKNWESERKFQGMTKEKLEQYKQAEEERVKRNLQKAATQNTE